MLHNSLKMPPSCFSPYLSFAPKWCKNAAARKVVFVVCEQQWRRPTCASGQSDQRLCYSLSRKKIDKLAISKLSIFYLVSVTEQTGFSFTWSQTLKKGFFAPKPIISGDRYSTNEPKIHLCISTTHFVGLKCRFLAYTIRLLIVCEAQRSFWRH